MRLKKNNRTTNHNHNNNMTTFRSCRSSNIPNERITATKYTNADWFRRWV